MNKASISIAAASLATVLLGLHAVPAAAQDSTVRHVITVPAGATVVVLSPGVAIADPAAPPFPANELAALRQMMAGMDTLMAMPMPDPAQLARSVMQDAPQGIPAGFPAGFPVGGLGQGGVMVTMISTGNGTCRQTVRYGAPGADGQPVIHVSQTGNACAQLMPAQTTGAVDAARPAPDTLPVPTTPAPTTRAHTRLWTVSNPPESLRTASNPPESLAAAGAPRT